MALTDKRRGGEIALKCPECGSTNVIVDLDMIATFTFNDEGEIAGIHIPEDEMIEAAQEIMDKPELRRYILQCICEDCGADDWLPNRKEECDT